MHVSVRYTVFLGFAAALLTGCSEQDAQSAVYRLTLTDTQTTKTIKQIALRLPARLDQDFRGPCRWAQETGKKHCRASLQDGHFTLSYFPAQAPQQQFVLEGRAENAHTAQGRVQLFNGQGVQVVAFFRLTDQDD